MPPLGQQLKHIATLGFGLHQFKQQDRSMVPERSQRAFEDLQLMPFDIGLDEAGQLNSRFLEETVERRYGYLEHLIEGTRWQIDTRLTRTNPRSL